MWYEIGSKYYNLYDTSSELEGWTNLKIFDESISTFFSDILTLEEDVGNVSALHVAEQVPQFDAV